MGFEIKIITNLVQNAGKLMKIFFTCWSPNRLGSMTLYFIISVVSFIFPTSEKKSSSTFKVCDSSLKAVTWQSGNESRAFIHLKRATPMMSVTDDCKTLPPPSPRSQLWSLRAEGKVGGGRGDNYQYKWSPANDAHCWIPWSSLQGNLRTLICFVDE